MNREDIIKMAREAWFGDGPEMPYVLKELERFAYLVAAAECEACAQVCEQFEEDMGHGIPQRCADAIRARGEK
jgi:hypothetical protein